MPLTTDAEHDRRLMVLSEHIEDLNSKCKKFSRKDLLSYLKSQKIKTSQTNLIRDLEYLATNNKFVENIGLHYSQYMENVSQTYDFVETEALKIYNKKWTQSKAIKKQALNREGDIVTLTEVVTTTEIAAPKLGALKLIADVAKQRQELASGKNLELSAAMWIGKVKGYEEEIKRLKSKLPKEIKGVIKAVEN